MDQQLKQRLIGTTIAVSLIVIFVPLFFETKSQRTPNNQVLEMTELPKTLEERAVELPRSANDDAESGNTDNSAMNGSGYRIVPLNDPPLKPAPRNAANGREMANAGQGGEEDYAILDEGSAREPESLPQVGKPTVRKPIVGLRPLEAPNTAPRAGVYALDGGDSNRNRSAYPSAEIPVNKPQNAPQVPANPPRQPPVSEAAHPVPGDAGSWMIQAGSFTGEANARNLVEKLRKSSFPAFVEVIPSESGVTMYRVRIGPESSKAHADQVRARLENAVGIKGIVVPR